MYFRNENCPYIQHGPRAVTRINQCLVLHLRTAADATAAFVQTRATCIEKSMPATSSVYQDQQETPRVQQSEIGRHGRVSSASPWKRRNVFVVDLGKEERPRIEGRGLKAEDSQRYRRSVSDSVGLNEGELEGPACDCCDQSSIAD